VKRRYKRSTELSEKTWVITWVEGKEDAHPPQHNKKGGISSLYKSIVGGGEDQGKETQGGGKNDNANLYSPCRRSNLRLKNLLFSSDVLSKKKFLCSFPYFEIAKMRSKRKQV